MHYRSFVLPIALFLLGTAFFACHRAAEAPQVPALEKSTGYTPESSPAPEANAVAADEAESGDASAAKGKADPAPPQAAASSVAAVVSRWDSVKKLVRTAEMRFQTPGVLPTTLAVEDIVRQNGGFVLENNLSETTRQQYRTQASRDSSLETTVVDIKTHLSFRVPFAQLDTTLRAIGRLADRIDVRSVRAEDVSLRALEQQLADARYRQHQIRIQQAIDQTGGKLNAITDAQDRALSAAAAADAARLEQLRIDDAVQLSTVQVDLYQRPVVRHEMVANLKQVDSWKPAFASQAADALLDGGRAVQVLVLLVLQLWPLWLALGAGWFLWRRQKQHPATV